MKPYLLDIESIPRPEPELLKLMPEELLNPRMPDELQNFTPPDLSKCPVYGGDAIKQQAWREKTLKEAQDKYQASRAAWTLKTAEDRQKWLSDAALHAPRGTVKIIGLRDVQDKTTLAIIIGTTDAERAKINAAKEWPCKVKFLFMAEKEALEWFTEFVTQKIGRVTTLKQVHPSSKVDYADKSEGGVLVGYYIAGFDLPFILRRSMITGAKICKKLRKGRHFDNELYIDLDEEYKMGERELKIGGLKGLSTILGVQVKQGDGEGFCNLWRDDCIAAINYHLSEGLVIEACAKKMGII